MRNFNYYKWFLNTYNKMPRPIRFCICCVVRRTHGQGWYGTFALKSVLKTISSVNIDVEYVDIFNDITETMEDIIGAI